MTLAGGFLGRYVSRNAKYRGAFQRGLGEACEEVGGPGSKRADANPGAAGELALGVGHVGGGRLVMGQDEFNPAALQGVEHGKHFAAGNTIGAPDTL